MFNQDLHDKASKLLFFQMTKKTRCLEKAERAIRIIEDNDLIAFGHHSRGLVHFSDLLKRFLFVHKKNNCLIEDENLASMIARCIESIDESFLLWERKCSLEQIFEYSQKKKINLKLLREKYTFNKELLDFCRKNQACDKHYEAFLNGTTEPYLYETTIEKETLGKYSGYRDAYHCLLYPIPKHLHDLIKRWKKWGDDCTGDAARDFFGLCPGCPIEIIIGKVELLIKNGPC